MGAGGMLGQDVVRISPGAIGYTHAQLDVTDRDAVGEAIRRDDVVINCAAWTDVDGAEEHEQEAMRINRDGARNVARGRRRGAVRVERLRRSTGRRASPIWSRIR